MKVKSLSRVRLLVTPWTAAHQAPLSMGFFQAGVLEWGAIAFSEISGGARVNGEQISVFYKLLKLYQINHSSFGHGIAGRLDLSFHK